MVEVVSPMTFSLFYMVHGIEGLRQVQKYITCKSTPRVIVYENAAPVDNFGLNPNCLFDDLIVNEISVQLQNFFQDFTNPWQDSNRPVIVCNRQRSLFLKQRCNVSIFYSYLFRWLYQIRFGQTDITFLLIGTA